MLLRRFFLVKAMLPVLGIRGVLGRTERKRRKIAALGALFLAVCLTAQLAASAWAPDMLMVFSYEEAARGQNPNVTRFNESNILSDDILERVIQRGGFGISVEQLSKCPSISTPLDAEKLDVTQESDMKISTEYRVRCSGRAALYGTDPKTVLNFLTDVYWENFVLNYAENDSILDLSFEKLEGMEYLDAKDYLEMQANKLRKPIITEEDLMIQQSMLDNGELDYELNPTRYVVSFHCGVSNGKEYPRKVLNQILQEYASYYGKNHVNTSLAANPVSDITTKGYDYLEMAEVMDDTLTNIAEHLSDKVEWNGEFRSSRTGRSFQDLKDEFAFIRDVEVRQLFSEILAGRITKDRDLLLEKYRNRNNNLVISNNAAAFEIDRIQGIIGAYEDAMGEFSVPAVNGAGENVGDVLQNNVLPDVYDDWNEDEDGNWAPVDRTAEYDVLLRKYIEDRTLYDHNIIDSDYNNYILGVFANAPASSSQAAQDQIQAEITRLAEEINALQSIYYETNDEYNEYLGAQNIMMLSSVRVTERFPILIFTVLIVVIFGALGCAEAALFGRIEDFIEYYAFTNKVDGLPNRAKCDRFIASREGRPLPETFACVVCKLANLQVENARLGRETGDQMLKDFAGMLTSVFPPSDKLFVGNNGAGQYLIFADSLEADQIEAALFQMAVALEQRSQDQGYLLDLRHSYAQASKEQCYYIRELLSIAIKRVNAAGAKSEASAVRA